MKGKTKILGSIYRVLKGILTLFLILIIIVILVQKVSQNSIAINGMRIFNIASGSMIPKYQIGDIIIVKSTKPDDIEVGNDITYKGQAEELKGLVITHEVIDKREENNKYYFVTKGIANDVADPEISEDAVYGKVIYKTIVFSFLGRIMSNNVAYYILFIVVGGLVSYQIIRNFILDKEEEEDNSEDEEKNNE